MIFVHALGTAHIDTGSAQIRPRRSALSFSLLLYLAVECGRHVSRATLQELLFPDKSELNAQHSLRELIYKLRQQRVELDTDAQGVALAPHEVQFDVAALLERERPTPAELRAIEGGLLPGFAPTHSEAFTEWLDAYRAKTSFELRKILLREIERAKRAGDWTATEAAARACLVLEPLNEQATLALAEVLTILGEKVSAVGVLDTYIDGVRRGSPSLAVPALRLKRRISEHALHAYAAPRQLPFAGRGAEMALLNERFVRAARGTPQCLALHGEPGIGKSRLAAELSAQAHLAGSPVVRTGCQPHERARPLGAFVDLVPMLLRLPGALGCSPESMGWLQRMLQLSAPEPSNTEVPVSPEAVALAVTRAIVDLVDAIASEATLVMLIEDVQWLDDVSLRVLESVVTGSGRRLLVLLTTRDDESLKPFVGSHGWLEMLPLTPLASDACVDVLRRMSALDDQVIDERLCLWMADTSGGNPFYLESLVAHYRTTKQAYTVPDKLTALVDQRVRSLSETARDVLGVIVTLEKFATLARVEAALEINAMLLLRSIRELETASMVRGGVQLEPAHWLIAESVDRTTAPVSRQYTHRRIAHVLQETATDASTSPGQLWACAEHWAKAGETERSAALFSQCARHSLAIGRARDAGELFLRAAEQTPSPGRHELAIETLAAVSPSNEADIIRRAIPFLDQSRPPCHDDAELAQLITYTLFEEHVGFSVTRLGQCIREPSADLNHRLGAARNMLVACDEFRLVESALENAELLFELWREAPEDNPLSLTGQLIFHATFGIITRVAELSGRLQELAAHSRIDIAADYQRKAGIGFWRSGRNSDARRAFELSFRDGQRAGLLRLQLSVALMLALLNLEDGDQIASAEWLSRAHEMSDSAPMLGRGTFFLTVNAEVALALDNRPELRRIYAASSKFESTADNIRFRRWRRALGVIVRHFDSEPLDVERTIQELTKDQIPEFEAGEPGDFEISVLLRVLADRGLNTRAQVVAEEYFRNFRRANGAISAALMRGVERVTNAPWQTPVIQPRRAPTTSP